MDTKIKFPKFSLNFGGFFNKFKEFSGVGAWMEWTDRDGFMDGFKKVDVSVHTSMCDGRMGRIWTDTSIKNGRNGRIKDELFA